MFHTGSNTTYMIKLYLVILIIIFINEFYFPDKLIAQDKNKNFVEWSTWLLIQGIPSPVFFQDKNEIESRYNFGLRWQITPINISFNINKLVNPVSLFKVNPLKRNIGSMEILIEPQWTMSNFKYAELKRFSLGTGMRIYLPLKEYGEYLSSSIAVKYNLHKRINGAENNYAGIEAGIYSFFGIAGIRFNYNFNSSSTYNISLNLRYY